MSEPANFRQLNGLCTYLEARRYLDQMFTLNRKAVDEEIVKQWQVWLVSFAVTSQWSDAGEDIAIKAARSLSMYRRRACELVNEAWKEAIIALAQTCLAKNRRTSSRVTVRTVNYKGKALPTMSQSARRARGEKRQRSSARSHVKGRYVPINAPSVRGRPRKSPEEKKRRKKAYEMKRRQAAKDATAKARAEKGWKPYRRSRGGVGRANSWQSEKSRAGVRGRAIRAVRVELGKASESAKDGRKNHHPEYGYRAPKKRVRRTKAQVERWGRREGGRVKRKPVVLSSWEIIAQSAFLNGRASVRRIAGAREYWEKVKKLARERMIEGAAKVGRPFGSGDKKPRARRRGGNSGSFGSRKIERSDRYTEWLTRKQKLTGMLRAEIGLVTWAGRRVGVYRNDATGHAQAVASLRYRESRVQRVRDLLAQHWRKRPSN